MYIEELKEEEGECEREEQKLCVDLSRGEVVVSDAKRVLVGAGARALFYPTLLYNVLRNKIQSEFRWWDRVDQFVLLGAVPFPADVPCLKELGVCGVVTLNEPYETLVPTSLYHAHGIDHLVIPTRDYLFAPSYGDICQAVNFIHENASHGKTTYVHCKAGRGRSTTIVLCYLVEYKQMTPDSAYKYVRSIRPRVLLAPSQWQAVQDYYLYRTKNTESNVCTDMAVFDDGSVVVATESDLHGYDSSVVGNDMLAELSLDCRVQFASQAANTGSNVCTDRAVFDDGSVVVVTESDLDGYADSISDASGVGNDMLAELSLDCRVQFASQAANTGSNVCTDRAVFDDGSVVVVTESDLDGYADSISDASGVGNDMLAELSLACRVQFASQAAIARLSCLWLRRNEGDKMSREKLGSSVGPDQLGRVGVDIRVY